MKYAFALLLTSLLAAAGAFAQGPDLLIEQFTSRTSAITGGGFYVAVRVKNSGNQPAGSSTLRHALSPLGTPQDRSDDVPIGECTLPEVAPGETETCRDQFSVGMQVIIPGDLAPGVYLLVATADSDSQVAESDEGNNTRVSDSGPFTVTGLEFQCQTNSGVPPIIRSTGFTERIVDINLHCILGTPTAAGQPVPLADIDVELNVPVTTRRLNGDDLEALLLIDEPAPENQVVCPAGSVCETLGVGAEPGVDYAGGGVANVYQGELVTPCRVRFRNVPVDPAGENVRTLRIVNLSVDGTRVWTPSTPELWSSPPAAFATVSATGAGGFFIHEATEPAAFAQHPVTVDALASSNPDYDYEVTFGERYSTAFLRRNTATSPSTAGDLANQDDPGFPYFTETGFYNSYLPQPLDTAGLADTGTRLLMRFDAVPEGQQIFVSVEPTSTGAFGSFCENETRSAILVGFGADGTGGDAGNPVPPAQLAPAPGIAAVPIANGAGAAVFEIVDESFLCRDELTFGVKLVGEGHPSITGTLAPLSQDSSASATEPLPRFFDPAANQFSTPGLYSPATGTWYIRTSLDPGPAYYEYPYGPGGADWAPLCGDWSPLGSGNPPKSRVTAGLYHAPSGTWFLKDLHGAGPANRVFPFGPGDLGWKPVVGDWLGVGIDFVGLYDPASSFWFLRHDNAAGPADSVFSYGPGELGWLPVVGDWDGDGTDTPGLYDPSSGLWFLRNSNSSGPADHVFSYGPGGLGWIPLVGDWNRDGVDTVGLYDPASGTWFLRDSNDAGPAGIVFSYGPGGAGWLPVVGSW